jgi:Cu(I)/Ag(I) efflux system membrane fusion protein
MGHVLNNYYAVATRLADDSVENINENLDLIISNSRKVRDMDLDISEGLLKRLSGVAGKIEDSANEMKGMELEKAREKFKGLSQSMINYLKEFQGKDKDAERAYVYYCPMVDASWLQKEKGTLNPYYGFAMLKCGSVKEEIP